MGFRTRLQGCILQSRAKNKKYAHEALILQRRGLRHNTTGSTKWNTIKTRCLRTYRTLQILEALLSVAIRSMTSEELVTPETLSLKASQKPKDKRPCRRVDIKIHLIEGPHRTPGEPRFNTPETS